MPAIAKETKKQAKKAFLDALTKGHSISAAAKKARMGRVTFYRWRTEDPEFQAEWDDAWEARGDWYEDQNRKQAAKGSMAAILNGLRIHGRIVEKRELTGKEGGPISIRVTYDDGDGVQG